MGRSTPDRADAMYLKLFTRYPQFVKRKALYVPASMRLEAYVSCAIYGVLGLAGGPDAILHSRQDAQVPRREDVMGDFDLEIWLAPVRNGVWVAARFGHR